jgi:hypothetical protein
MSMLEVELIQTTGVTRLLEMLVAVGVLAAMNLGVLGRRSGDGDARD